MENKIPTAEEFLNLLGVPYRNGLENRRGNYISPDELIKFAKLHVEAQTEAILKITHKNGIPRIVDNKESIIDAYPLTNIK